MSSIPQKDIVTVSQLNNYLKRLLAADRRLNSLHVRGEISNFYLHSASGHIYFTMKDENSCLNCVFFRRQNRRLDFRPEDGMSVIASGHIGIYEKRGQYQLYVDSLVPDGIEALYMAFEQRKNKLASEGLFDDKHKRSLPFLPRCIALVTSPRGAALRDMLSIIERRFPHLEIIVVPVTVQGEEAPQTMIEALEKLRHIARLDAVIIGRGGGSFESLFCFNDERLARKVFSFPVPVISAVGHETDTTILDYVADMRAPTPSAAAELVVPEKNELRERIDHLTSRLERAVTTQLRDYRSRLQRLHKSRIFRKPLASFEPLHQQVDELSRALQLHMSHFLHHNQQRLSHFAGKLDTLSPLRTLSRGYSLVRSADGRKMIKTTEELEEGDEIQVVLRDGLLDCLVKSIREGEGIGTYGKGTGEEDSRRTLL